MVVRNTCPVSALLNGCDISCVISRNTHLVSMLSLAMMNGCHVSCEVSRNTRLVSVLLLATMNSCHVSCVVSRNTPLCFSVVAGYDEQLSCKLCGF